MLGEPLALCGFKVFHPAMAVVGATMNLGGVADIADALMFIMAMRNLLDLCLLIRASMPRVVHALGLCA